MKLSQNITCEVENKRVGGWHHRGGSLRIVELHTVNYLKGKDKGTFHK